MSRTTPVTTPLTTAERDRVIRNLGARQAAGDLTWQQVADAANCTRQYAHNRYKQLTGQQQRAPQPRRACGERNVNGAGRRYVRASLTAADRPDPEWDPGIPRTRINWTAGDGMPLAPTMHDAPIVVRLMQHLGAWGIVATEQAATMTGTTAAAARKALVPMLRAGLVQRGEWIDRATNWPADGPTIWRVNYGTHVKKWLAGFPADARPHVPTATANWNNEKHSLVCAELALRTSEAAHGRWIHVAPEAAASMRVLLGTDTKRAADLAVVRDDGLVIAVEVTRTIDKDVKQKMRAWAREIHRNPDAYRNLVVVFVGNNPSLIWEHLNTAAAGGDPQHRPAYRRIAVASLHDWWPAEQQTSPAADAMAMAGLGWQSTALAHPPVAEPDRARARRLIRHRASVAGMPDRLRPTDRRGR